MKIIGKTQENYIVEISGRELDRLDGTNKSAACYAHNSFQIGETLDVSALYNWVYEIQSSAHELDRYGKIVLEFGKHIIEKNPLRNVEEQSQ